MQICALAKHVGVEYLFEGAYVRRKRNTPLRRAEIYVYVYFQSSKYFLSAASSSAVA